MNQFQIFLKFHLSKFGIKTIYFDSDLKNLKSMINKNTKIIYLESPGSLNYEVLDIIKICRIAKKNNIITIMDNTWSTFLGCNPMYHGVDIVIESATKYFNGHSDNFCGFNCMFKSLF